MRQRLGLALLVRLKIFLLINICAQRQKRMDTFSLYAVYTALEALIWLVLIQKIQI